MIELEGFPFRNQLADIPTADGKPDENKSYNCVPTVTAACIQFYTGVRVGADKLKDAVYGQGHVGGGAEVAYGPYVAAHYGLHIGYEPLPSASQAIIQHIRTELRAGHPVIVTMHSKWSTPWWKDVGDGLHVGVAYAISEADAGELHIMNPWGGFDHHEPVKWWRDRLGIGIWPVSRIAAPKPAPAPKPPEYVWNEATKTLTGNGAKLVVADLGKS